jgi:hypothetical protein
MKVYGGVDAEIHIFLISVLAGGEWSASRPGRFTLEERAPYPLDRRLGAICVQLFGKNWNKRCF